MNIFCLFSKLYSSYARQIFCPNLVILGLCLQALFWHQQTDRCRRTDGRTVGLKYRQTDGRTEVQIDGWTLFRTQTICKAHIDVLDEYLESYYLQNVKPIIPFIIFDAGYKKLKPNELFSSYISINVTIYILYKFFLISF